MLESILSLFMFFQAAPTNYEKALGTIESLQKNNPAVSEIFVVGQNNQGQPIKGIKIGHGPTAALVVATHHGNEYGSTAVALSFSEYLIKNPIKDLTVYVVPVLNIGGYNRNNRYESNLSISVDPNRDYPSPCKKDQAFKLKSTQAIAQFLEDKNIAISATLHTYFPAVVYPWGISTKDLSTPYDAEYIKLVNYATEESGYQVGNNTEVLYPADGTFEDYAYWKHGIWSLLFELGFSHSPDTTAVQNMIDVNNPGLRRFLEKAPRTRVTQHQFEGRCDNSRMPKRVILE